MYSYNMYSLTVMKISYYIDNCIRHGENELMIVLQNNES